MGNFVTLLLPIALLYGLWLFYLAVMNLQRAKETGAISRTALYLGTPILIVALILDAIVNIFIATAIFLDPPKEALLTARLKRYVKDCPGTWRADLAIWLALELLDTFDPSGKHI